MSCKKCDPLDAGPAGRVIVWLDQRTLFQLYKFAETLTHPGNHERQYEKYYYCCYPKIIYNPFRDKTAHQYHDDNRRHPSVYFFFSFV
jgi:hypothetical protein